MNYSAYRKWGFCSVLMTLFIVKSFGQINRPSSTVNTQAGNNNTQYIKPLEAGLYFIKIKNTGKYWGVEGINPNNGAKVVQWDFVDQANHKFQIDKTADGFYTIKALHSGRFLNVAGQSVQDGAPIIQWDFVNQDNMKFNILSINGGWVIRGKQSNKDVKLSGNINNAANGTTLIINGNAQAGMQVFTFEKATGNPPLSTRPPSTTFDNKIVATNLSFRLPDGTTVNRTIDASATKILAQRPQRKQERVVASDQTCVDKTAVIDMGTTEEVPISSSDYKMNNAPSLMYDIKAFYGSDYRNSVMFPFAEKRQPITLIASVRNISGSISETVNEPTLRNVNQAITNLYSRFPADPNKVSSESLVYRASSLENSTEFFMKIGAKAHYLGGSVDASMTSNDKKHYKYLYFEGTKTLFTIMVERNKEGFFTENIPNENNIGFISRANYGVKVIGKVEIKNTENAIGGSVKVAYDALFAGGEVSLEAMKTEISKESKVFLYVVGGTSNTVVSCTIANMQQTIDNILRNVNYFTAEPISLTFSNLRGDPMKYKDLTNNFTFTQCTPNGGNRDVTIEIDKIERIGTDCDLYGDVWIELVRPNDNMARYRDGSDNRLFKVEANQYVSGNDLLANYKPNKQVVFRNVPASELQNAEFHIYYNLKDHDDFDDDLLEQRNGHKVRIPNTNWDFYRSELKLDGTTSQSLVTDFVDAGSGARLTISVKSTPK